MARAGWGPAIAAITLTAGCGGGSKGGEAVGPLSTYPRPAVSTAGELIAEIGPVRLTTGEVERRLKMLSPFVRQQLADPEQLVQWVENEVRLETIAQRAWSEGLHEDPVILGQIRQLLVSEYTKRAMDAKVGELEPNDKELLAAYEARREEYDKPAKVRLSHIVRFVEDDAQRKAAHALLEKVKTEVVDAQKKNDHAQFGRAARDHSEDEATKLGAGDLQFLTREQLAERYGEAVAARSFDEAQVGDLYVADAPNAVVLFKKTGFRKALQRGLEEARPELRAQLVQEKRQRRYEDWSKELVGRSGVAVSREAIARVKIPDADPPTPAAPRAPTPPPASNP